MKNTFAQGLYQVSSTRNEALGTYRLTPDGRGFRYAYNGAAALAVGKCCMMASAVANHIECSLTSAAAIGDVEITVTVGATAVTENLYADGYLQVNNGTGEGYQYQIDSNTACGSSGDTIVTLRQRLQLNLVTSATSEVSLLPNPWYAVVIPTGEETGPAGVAITAVPINYYFWIQTGGMGCVLSYGNDVVGTIQENGLTAGTVDVANGFDKCFIGTVVSTNNVATEYKPIWLSID
jgi:hypothetical protein